MEKVRISLRFTAAQQASLSAEAELRESSVALQSLEVSFLSMNIAYFSSFNKILTRFAIQAKGPDGKWTRKPLAYRESNNVHLLITRPHEICVYLILNIFTLLAVTQSVDNLFHSFIVLCENECFLMSNLH